MPSTVADRLREFVRDRVKPGARHYERGSNARLAEHFARRGLNEDAAWVSAYVDPDANPRRNADIDAALAICDFFKVSLPDFVAADEPRHSVPPDLPLSDEEKETLLLLRKMSKIGRDFARQNLVFLADAFPKQQRRERDSRPHGKRPATMNTKHGKQPGDEETKRASR